MKNLVFAAFAVSAAFSFSSAEAVTLNVAGTSNPFLAGLPDGTTDPADGRDNAPEESPVLVTGLSFAPGDTLQFSATGLMSRGPGALLVGPDGNLSTLAPGGHNGGAANGISDYFMPQSALLGVFLSDDLPTSSPAPAALDDFATSVGGVAAITAAEDFTTLSPELKQVFFIGDGLDLSSNTQSFIVPDGATRLFLGTSDLFGWFNNLGGFDVTVTSISAPPPPPPSAVPLPAGGVLLLTGLGLLALRRKVAG